MIFYLFIYLFVFFVMVVVIILLNFFFFPLIFSMNFICVENSIEYISKRNQLVMPIRFVYVNKF